jgi:hypothetical protein
MINQILFLFASNISRSKFVHQTWTGRTKGHSKTISKRERNGMRKIAMKTKRQKQRCEKAMKTRKWGCIQLETKRGLQRTNVWIEINWRSSSKDFSDRKPLNNREFQILRRVENVQKNAIFLATSRSIKRDCSREQSCSPSKSYFLDGTHQSITRSIWEKK